MGTSEKCLKWQREAGISDKTWDKLRNQYFDLATRGDRDSWVNSLLGAVGDFFFEDARNCVGGNVAACGLFALNFVPGVGVAAKGIKAIGKVATKLAPAGSKVAKACGSSFVPGTLVLMADGSSKAIEEVRVGDYVVATDPLTGVSADKRVTHVITSIDTKNLVEISASGSGEAGVPELSLIATEGHPFWVPSIKQWTNAGDLQLGQWLQTSAGIWVQLDSIRRWTDSQRVHNLTIADIHTYYVGAGHAAVLVHNTGPCWVGPPLTISSSQFGKKWGKHAKDYGLDPSDPKAREWYIREVRSTFANPHEVRRGPWNPHRGGGEGYWYYRKDNMLVLTKPDGQFVTAFPNTGNKWWDQAKVMSR